MKGAKIIANIILGDLNKIDSRFSIKKVTVSNSLDEIQEYIDENISYVIAATAKNVNGAINKDANVYMPYSLYNNNFLNSKTCIYFELEILPFFRSFTETIKKEVNPRGVFRYRRITQEVNILSMIVGELFVFSSLFGEPEDIHIKRTDPSIIPSHIIIMINFGGGTMAHIEYTAGNQEKIELEWSGIKNIIEFDSEQMKPVHPSDRTLLPLTYSVDDIVSLAKVIDEKILSRLDYFQKLMDRGIQI